jgi:uncharacterized protein (TIGR03435 family)
MKDKTRNFILCLAMTALAVLPLLSQVAKKETFEVATVKPNPDGFIELGGGQRVLSGRTHCHGIDTRAIPGDLIGLPALGRCSVRNSTLKEIIDVAYNLRVGPVRSKVNQMILGGPDWASTTPFDIEGKAEDPSTTTEQELHVMLQDLLSERFKLRFHRETRELSALALTVYKNESKLKEAAVDEQPNFSMPTNASISTPTVTGRKVPIGTLVDFLSLRFGRIVTDETGLKGRFDFTLTWTPDETELAPNGTPSRSPLPDQPGPSLMTALQEQLGLKLESQKLPVALLVIDSALTPNPN